MTYRRTEHTNEIPATTITAITTTTTATTPEKETLQSDQRFRYAQTFTFFSHYIYDCKRTKCWANETMQKKEWTKKTQNKHKNMSRLLRIYKKK